MVDRLIAIAGRGAGLTLKQLALAFVLDDPTITAAIIGPRTLEQLDDLLATAALPGGLVLPDGVRAAIDADRRSRPQRQPRRRRLTRSTLSPMRRATAIVLAGCVLACALFGAGASSVVHALDGPGVVTVATGVPAGATAVLANLTMVNGQAAGYITADGCNALVDGPQTRSNGNHGIRAAVANLAVVPVGADGSFCLYHQRSVDLLSDVQGYIGPASTDSLRFVPMVAGSGARHARDRGDAGAVAAGRQRGPGRHRCTRRCPGGARQHHHGRRAERRLRHGRPVLAAGGWAAGVVERQPSGHRRRLEPQRDPDRRRRLVLHLSPASAST